jgi:DNA primase
MTTWINFKELRARLDFEQVLKHYGVEVKRRGKQHHGYCPLPNHNGKRNSPSFSANLEKGIFQCFGCGAKGNLLEFSAMMENVDPKDGAAFRKVAGELQKKFCAELGSISKQKDMAAQKKQPETKPKENVSAIVNQPLDFELKGLDSKHPYLLNRGFTQNTVDHFGLGFCSRGYLKDRVAIPLHDNDGKLVGYSGRVVDDSKIGEDNPRYRFPGERERDGEIYEFRKTVFLYNAFRIKGPVDDLIVVEGFTSVWWFFQNDFPNTVATMGADCSEKQGELILPLVKPGGSVWIMPDGDKAGERHAQSLLTLISPHRLMRWLKLPEGKQPTDLSKEQLKLSFIN